MTTPLAVSWPLNATIDTLMSFLGATTPPDINYRTTALSNSASSTGYTVDNTLCSIVNSESGLTAINYGIANSKVAKISFPNVSLWDDLSLASRIVGNMLHYGNTTPFDDTGRDILGLWSLTTAAPITSLIQLLTQHVGRNLSTPQTAAEWRWLLPNDAALKTPTLSSLFQQINSKFTQRLTAPKFGRWSIYRPDFYLGNGYDGFAQTLAALNLPSFNAYCTLNYDPNLAPGCLLFQVTSPWLLPNTGLTTTTSASTTQLVDSSSGNTDVTTVDLAGYTTTTTRVQNSFTPSGVRFKQTTTTTTTVYIAAFETLYNMPALDGTLNSRPLIFCVGLEFIDEFVNYLRNCTLINTASNPISPTLLGANHSVDLLPTLSRVKKAYLNLKRRYWWGVTVSILTARSLSTIPLNGFVGQLLDDGSLAAWSDLMPVPTRVGLTFTETFGYLTPSLYPPSYTHADPGIDLQRPMLPSVIELGFGQIKVGLEATALTALECYTNTQCWPTLTSTTEPVANKSSIVTTSNLAITGILVVIAVIILIIMLFSATRTSPAIFATTYLP